MAFIDKVLDPPSYGWQDEKGELSKPTKGQIWQEIFQRINIFRNRKNWIAPLAWFWAICLIPFMVIFIGWHFHWALALLAIFFGMVGMSTHGTVWYHRYCTHKAYRFRNGIWRFIVQNLVPKVIPEEIYVVSHHVHHAKSDKPGDPYNAQGGFLYCFMADITHQPIAKDLDETDYGKAVQFLAHTGIYCNTYAQYLKWGSVSHPVYTLALWLGNWAFWYTAYYFIGGHGLALALFTGAFLWALGVRTFNYQGHGMGQDKRVDGVDYNWKDLSINQKRPGLLGGEWHNNHHLFPNSARAGFLPGQLDNAWIVIYILSKIGGITSYRNSKQQFLDEYVKPNRKAENTRKPG
jgi:stearoyl-CoA desaturase (delta-9 desaturase)